MVMDMDMDMDMDMVDMEANMDTVDTVRQKKKKNHFGKDYQDSNTN